MFGPIKHLMTTPSSCLETATRLRTALLVGYGTMVGYGWLWLVSSCQFGTSRLGIS